jgi:hypothetical protein
MVIPATRITAANFNENEAPRQMPVNHRTPLMDVPQLDRRISTRDTAATVAATRIVERAITPTAPTPHEPLALTGATAGIVRSDGASTGGLEPGAGSRSGAGSGEGCGVVTLMGWGAITGAGGGGTCGVGEEALSGCDVGIDEGVGSGVGAGDSVGRGEGAGPQQPSSQQWPPSPGSSDPRP